jgi:hypothetical protein
MATPTTNPPIRAQPSSGGRLRTRVAACVVAEVAATGVRTQVRARRELTARGRGFGSIVTAEEFPQRHAGESNDWMSIGRYPISNLGAAPDPASEYVRVCAGYSANA